MNFMSHSPCLPSCAIPCSKPCIPIGSCGYGGGYGGGYSMGGYGMGSYGGGSGIAASAAQLGTLPGVNPSCISQIPSSEVVIQPPPVVVTMPGAIMASSCQPLAVGGYSPCASGGYGGGVGGYGGYLGRSKRRQSICGQPC